MATIRTEIPIIAVSGQYPVILLDTSKYPGATYYWEAIHSGSTTVKLLRNSDSSEYASLSLSANVLGRVAFTPESGAVEYRADSDVVVARIVIIQADSFTSQCQIPLMHSTGFTTSSTTPVATGFEYYWQYVSANWDGTLVFEAEVIWSGDTSGMGYTYTIELQEDNGSFGGWTTAAIIVNAGTGTSLQRSRVSFTPTNGRHYRIVHSTSNSMATNVRCHGLKVIVTQSGTVTKGERYYSHGIGNSFNTNVDMRRDHYWDPAHWSGVDAVFYNEITASSSGTNTLKLRYDPNGTPTDITASAVTGTNRARGSAMTMPGSITTWCPHRTAGTMFGQMVVVLVTELASDDYEPSLNKTLDNITSSSVFTTEVQGLVSKTLDQSTLVSLLGPIVTGALAKTLDDSTLDSVVVFEAVIELELSKTLDDSSLVSAVKVDLDLNLGVALDSSSLSSDLEFDVNGVVAKTLDDSTLSSVLEGLIGLDLASTLAASTLSSLAEIIVSLESSSTLGESTLVAEAEIVVTGDLSQTLDSSLLISTVELDLDLNLSIALDDSTLSSTLQLSNDAEFGLDATLDDSVLSSSTETEVAGSLAKTLDNSSLNSLVEIVTSLELTQTLGASSLNSETEVVVSGSLTQTLDNSTLDSELEFQTEASGDYDVVVNVNLDDSIVSSSVVVEVSGLVNQTLANSTLSSAAEVEVITAKPPLEFNVSAQLSETTLRSILRKPEQLILDMHKVDLYLKWRPGFKKPEPTAFDKSREATLSKRLNHLIRIEEFNIEPVYWIGASYIVTEFHGKLENSFTIKTVRKPRDVNFVLAIRWPQIQASGLGVVRYKLWSGIGEDFDYPLYRGELVPVEGFVLEIWNILGQSEVSLESPLDLITSLLVNPEDCCDRQGPVNDSTEVCELFIEGVIPEEEPNPEEHRLFTVDQELDEVTLESNFEFDPSYGVDQVLDPVLLESQAQVLVALELDKTLFNTVLSATIQAEDPEDELPLFGTDPVDPPGEGGEIYYVGSQYVWAFLESENPNTKLSAEEIACHKALLDSQAYLWDLNFPDWTIIGHGQFHWVWQPNELFTYSAHAKVGNSCTAFDGNGDAQIFFSSGAWALVKSYRVLVP